MSDVNFDKVVEFAYECLDKPKVDWKKQHIESRCPLCGDSRTKKNVRRFYIDFYPQYDTFIYKCFRCGESSNVIHLYSYLKGVSYNNSEKFLKNKIFSPEKLKKQINNNRQDSLIESISKPRPIFDIDFKKECYSLKDNPQDIQGRRYVTYLREFVLNRKPGIDCFVAHSGKYKARIIIPVYDGEDIVYFQGRSIFKETSPKYLNPDVEKENVILNLNLFNPDKYIVVTEGILDALSINGNQGTTVIGAHISDSFLKKLYEKTKTGIIIAVDNFKYDNQARNTLVKITNESRFRNKLKYFIYPDSFGKVKDLNELKMKFDVDDIYNLIISNSYSLFEFLVRFKKIK